MRQLLFRHAEFLNVSDANGPCKIGSVKNAILGFNRRKYGLGGDDLLEVLPDGRMVGVNRR